jgi:hypothetical protein
LQTWENKEEAKRPLLFYQKQGSIKSRRSPEKANRNQI